MVQKRLLGALVIILVLQSVVSAQIPGGVEYMPGELLVKFKPEATGEAIAALQAQVGLEAIKVFARTGVHHVRIRSNLTVPEAIARLQQHPAVEYAEPNYIRHLNRTPSDPRFPEMWGLHNTGQTSERRPTDSDGSDLRPASRRDLEHP